MRSQYDDLRNNQEHQCDVDKKDKKTQIVRIFREDKLIAKKITKGNKVSYFGIQGFEKHLTQEK